jgi:hypothetical protein
MKLSAEDRQRVYEFMRSKGYSRLTIKILLGYQPDAMDRMTIILGKGSEYDYKLLNDTNFRLSELKYFIEKSK